MNTKKVNILLVDNNDKFLRSLAERAKLKAIDPEISAILLIGHGDDKLKEAAEAINSTYFDKDEMGKF
jgi:hypothetical protein